MEMERRRFRIGGGGSEGDIEKGSLVNGSGYSALGCSVLIYDVMD